MSIGVDRPGVYQMPAEQYHADCCPEPSLSASVAHVLLTYSPAHARARHPKLNPAYEPEHEEKFDLGTAVHAYLLEGESHFALIDAPDWRTKAAREERDAARLEGRTPLLAEQWVTVKGMVEAARRQLERFTEPPRPLAGGQPEQTLVWQDDGVWCRARLDWLHDSGLVIDDYKSTGGSANPEAWIRGPLFSMGRDVQAAFYLRGLRAVTGQEARFRFVVQETFPPYALSVIGLAPDALALADKKVAWAITLWRDCLESGIWDGYPTRTCYADLPTWEETRWLAREYRDTRPADASDDGRPIDEQLFGSC